ncbi:MAG TPA: hypothetical protein VM618_09630, partial [Acidimicrobiia bacterium]|nr:hypothetical protein [Acidimicrobiia bacterium]
FGDARFYGSVPGLRQKGHNIGHASVISMAPTSTGRGYWMLDSVGGMFTFGDARFSGSVPSLVAAGKAPSASTASAMATHPKGDGYWILSTTGDVFGFGGAPDLGGL